MLMLYTQIEYLVVNCNVFLLQCASFAFLFVCLLVYRFACMTDLHVYCYYRKTSIITPVIALMKFSILIVTMGASMKKYFNTHPILHSFFIIFSWNNLTSEHHAGSWNVYGKLIWNHMCWSLTFKQITVLKNSLLMIWFFDFFFITWGEVIYKVHSEYGKVWGGEGGRIYSSISCYFNSQKKKDQKYYFFSLFHWNFYFIGFQFIRFFFSFLYSSKFRIFFLIGDKQTW